MKTLRKFERLYGEPINSQSNDYIFSELLETRSRSFGWSIKPHIHPHLFQIFLIKTKEFAFIQAKKQLKIKAPCIILVPASALHGFEFEDATNGRILSLSDTIVNNLLSNLNFQKPVFEDFQIISIPENQAVLSHIDSLLQEIDTELFHKKAAKFAMLQALLQQLFIAIFRLWQNNEPGISQESDPHLLSIFRKFKQYVRDADHQTTVKELADKLGISTVHLNRICQQIAECPASKILQNHILENAQKYLLHTTYSVSEIAYILNFTYPNYFTKFFKKQTGMTPKGFRKKNL